MSQFLKRFFVLVQLFVFTSQAALAQGALNYSYDRGPDLKTEMGRELLEINSRIPYFPGISKEILGFQKFRPAFGPMPWRMTQAPNSVKILFIGQDGTHIAEAAGRPATAGFGGRAQDLAKYFGVGASAAFINTYSFTIKGQYGSFEHPVIEKNNDGSLASVSYRSFVDNSLWMITQDLDSPIVQWRNSLIDWIIRNNRDSLQMIVLFGGAARDAMASYIISKGGKVGTRVPEKTRTTERGKEILGLDRLLVPESALTNAGGNNETPYPLTPENGDLYAEIIGKEVNYKIPMPKKDKNKDDDEGDDEEVKGAKDVLLAQKLLGENLKKWADRMVFTRGGIHGSGVMNPAQLGGYDLANQMEINGKKTISLNGLKISDDLTIEDTIENGKRKARDILVVQFPHPTALSMMKPAQAANAVGKALEPFKEYVTKRKWKIEADEGFENSFAAGEQYKYKRGDMGPETYDFGAPASRMVNVSSASRFKADKDVFGEENYRKVNAIVFGTRDKAKFDNQKILEMTLAKPSKYPSPQDMWTTRPISSQTRETFDPGPSPTYARLMKLFLPRKLIERNEINKDFGHYRGTFENPRVVIMADPDGYDDLITARALTGSRGQYIHGLMEDLGVGDQYLVIKTAPFSMEESNWKNIYKNTKAYREQLLTEVLYRNQPQLLIADGKYAATAIKEILGEQPSLPLIEMARSESGEEKDFGVKSAGLEIKKRVSGFKSARITGDMKDIPRSHLSYYARVWEGTSGDRVLTATDKKFQGRAFIEVAPYWAVSQKFQMSESDQEGIRVLKQKLEDAKVRSGAERVSEFVRRSVSWVKTFISEMWASLGRSQPAHASI